MLRHSFIHLPGIGLRTEGRLWRLGLTRWDMLLASPESVPAGALGRTRGERLLGGLAESADRLARGDAGYFGDRLASREAWRLFGEFHSQAAYLDIETNGLDLVTAVVVHREGQTLFFVRDENLHELPMHLSGVRLLVTYNGRCFDWPVLRATFGSLLPAPAAHLDLRYPLARFGFRGGLKGVEKAIGLTRPGELQEINGLSAVWLWRRHESGDRRAMPALLRYCAEDVLNLKYLAEWAYNALAGPLPVNAALFASPSRAVCGDLPVADRELMDTCRRAMAGFPAR